MTDFSKLKKELIKICEAQLLEKKQMMVNSLESLQNALTNESKSSAGDKYETGTEMIQIEKQKVQTQLGVLNTNFKLLNTASNASQKDLVQNGAMVITNNAKYFIGPSLGKITVNGDTVFVISPSSPIAQAMLNQKTGSEVKFNGQVIIVKSIC
jgi:archaellum component FlaF (FlaF/FlaG flagellin family)